MKEITKEFIKKQKTGFEFYIYNPLTKQMKLEKLNSKSIVFSPYCYEGLIFYRKWLIEDIKWVYIWR